MACQSKAGEAVEALFPIEHSPNSAGRSSSLTSLTSASSSLSMTLSCASCARWCHRCGFFFARLAGGAIASVARSISLAWDGVAPFRANSPGYHRHRGVGRILRCLRRVRRSADCRDLHVRRVRRVRRICRRLVHLFGGGDRGCHDHRHIVIVVSTTMRSSLRLPSRSRTSIYRHCRRCRRCGVCRRRSSRSTFSSSFLAIDVVAVVAPCDRRSSSSLLAIDSRDRRSSDRRFSRSSLSRSSHLQPPKTRLVVACSLASLVLRRRLVRSMGGEDPFVLLALAAFRSAFGRSHSRSAPKNKILLSRAVSASLALPFLTIFFVLLASESHVAFVASISSSFAVAAFKI